jgi:hypothetical protein
MCCNLYELETEIVVFAKMEFASLEKKNIEMRERERERETWVIARPLMPQPWLYSTQVGR